MLSRRGWPACGRRSASTLAHRRIGSVDLHLADQPSPPGIGTVGPDKPAAGTPGTESESQRAGSVPHHQVAADMKAEEDRPDDQYSTPIAPVGRISGRRFPRVGWIAITVMVVAAGSFLVGTPGGGSFRAPGATSGTISSRLVSISPRPSPTVFESASLPTASTATPAVNPPASTLSLDRALASARAAYLGSSPQIVAARVVRYGDVSRSSKVSPDSWVWVFDARGTFSFASCGGRTASPYPCPSPATTASVIVDLRTGAFIEADVPALP
jgi:hypothetical protein